MITHYNLPERQYVNAVVEYTDTTADLAGRSPRAVVDVVSLDAGAYADGYIELLKNGVCVLRAPRRFDAVGQFSIGCNRNDFTELRGHVYLNIVGRMRLRLRIVSFDQLEDVPEVI